MKRRQLFQYAGASFVSVLGMGVASQWHAVQAQSADSVTIQALGHTSFRFTGSGRRILVNPFRPVGCTAGHSAPQVEADLVMISSRLLDEGVVEGIPGNPRILSEPGIYEFTGLKVDGIEADHDREGGRRFGRNVMWRWNQGGLTILHMGGAAAPVSIEQQILIGRPDVVLVPVGGGPKAYTALEAQAAINAFNPRIVIPTHYRTEAADAEACDIETLDEFLTLMSGTPVRQTTGSISLSRSDLPESGMRIEVIGYPF
jgi:L-ascorbate metabolism protein UlaG (beta-lactamase superfamily)